MKAEAARPRTCFHSFRHCYRDALRNAGVSYEESLALGGWSGSSRESDNVSEAYGNGVSVRRLAQAISRLGYRGLDLSFLELSRGKNSDQTEVIAGGPCDNQFRHLGSKAECF